MRWSFEVGVEDPRSFAWPEEDGGDGGQSEEAGKMPPTGRMKAV